MRRAESNINRLPELEPLLHEVERQFPAEAAGFVCALSQVSDAWQTARREGRPLPRSLLTPGGYPMEINERSDSRELCWTAEPALPGAPIEAQLPRVLQHTGINLAADKTLSVFLQQPSPRFGCWMSLRHSVDGVAGKAYLEAGPQTHPHFLEGLHRIAPTLPESFSFVPMLAGIYPGVAGVSEYYGLLPNPNARSLHILFGACAVRAHLPLALCLLAELASVQTNDLLQRIRLGASLRAQGSKPPALTLFVHAPQIFESNVQARTRILSLALQLGGKLPLYEALSASLVDNAVDAPLHSVVSLKIGAKGLSCSVGYSPAALP
ncbi:MAG: hypothetical protein EOO08_13165 [Chitinophagaceae bacterium]|nr:MAG: hypothetical protein EOO08_13165 [Chitinophagaceae bacterium]